MFSQICSSVQKGLRNLELVLFERPTIAILAHIVLKVIAISYTE